MISLLLSTTETEPSGDIIARSPVLKLPDINVSIGTEVNEQKPYLHGMLFLWLQSLGSTRIKTKIL